MAAWHNARGREARQALPEAYLRGSSGGAGGAGSRDGQIQSPKPSAATASAPYTPAERRILTDAGADTGSPCS